MVLRLKACGIKPTEHMIDNECSEEFKQAIKSDRVTYQLVHQHEHRRNIAEKAIQMFNDHFVGVLCGTAAKIQMQLWCRILQQAEH